MTITRATTAAVLIFWVVVIPSAVAEDNVIRSCVKDGNGDVRIIGPTEACKKHEALITWPSDNGRALTVVDSLGQVVGPVVFPGTNQFQGAASLPMVAFAVNGTYVTLGVSRDYLCGGQNFFTSRGCSGIVFYTTPDCTGDPYLFPSGPFGASGPNLFGAAATLYEGDVSRTDYYAVPGTGQTILVRSRLELLPAETFCTAIGEASADVMPALPLDLSIFKPPFSLR